MQKKKKKLCERVASSENEKTRNIFFKELFDSNYLRRREIKFFKDIESLGIM